MKKSWFLKYKSGMLHGHNMKTLRQYYSLGGETKFQTYIKHSKRKTVEIFQLEDGGDRELRNAGTHIYDITYGGT